MSRRVLTGAVEEAVVLQRAREQSGLAIDELWVRYLALGGTSDLFGVDGYLTGAGGLDRRQHNILVVALNERFMDLGMNHPVPYLE
jgi:hypothetical protein